MDEGVLAKGRGSHATLAQRDVHLFGILNSAKALPSDVSFSVAPLHESPIESKFVGPPCGPPSSPGADHGVRNSEHSYELHDGQSSPKSGRRVGASNPIETPPGITSREEELVRTAQLMRVTSAVGFRLAQRIFFGATFRSKLGSKPTSSRF